jgi:hypothetical protein
LKQPSLQKAGCRKVLYFFSAVCFLLSASVSLTCADDTGFFPPAHDLFKPLLADPRELQYALRMVVPVSKKVLGEASMGDYLGLYRWALAGDAMYVQISIGGGAFGRFDLAATSNAMQVADFYGNLPFDLRTGKWSFRFMPYHTSSHLGDDYLKATGLTTTKHAWDNLRWLVSYDAASFLRLYGGYTYIFRTHPEHLGRNAYQGGFETYSPWWGNKHARVYWANDLQSWERCDWHPTFYSQLGLRMVKDPQVGRGVSLFVEYATGRQPQGQFFQNSETHWSLGLKLDIT